MLEFGRYLNLVYYWFMSRLHDEKDRKKFLNAINTPPLEVFQRAAAKPQEDYVPTWWKGDEAAARQGLALAAAMGVSVVIPTDTGG